MQTVIAMATIVAFLIALLYLKRDMDAEGAFTVKASTALFAFASLALFAVWQKPAQWEIGNYIILAVIAVIVVMAIGARKQGR